MWTTDSRIPGHSLAREQSFVSLSFRVELNFVDRDGDVMTVNAKVGDTLLDVAKDNDVDLEGKRE